MAIIGEEVQKPARLDRPYFIKADSDAVKQLEQLQEFYRTAPENVKSQLEQDIKMLSYGIAGEKNVAFELNNCYMPILVLHDLRIEYDGLTAQIDYLVITKRFVLIIECKNLIGNIEVNNNGDFIRTTEYKGKYKKEGIYSPITQSMRHIEMIKKIRKSRQNNFLTKALFEKFFHETYKSVVVLANPKTIINMKFAKKQVKEKIIRCDQLIEHIKKNINEKKHEIFKEKDMYELAEFFLSLHTPNTVDYTKKYFIGESEKRESQPKQVARESQPKQVAKESEPKQVVRESEPKKDTLNVEDTPLYKDLRRYRFEISKAEGVKPYFIYNNAQLEDLISVMPKTLNDIKKISGFGDVKIQKYGNAILEIVKRYS